MKNSLVWKSLISKIHPPLPLDPRETEKSLHLLKSYFQRRLDLQHPTVQSATRSPDTHLYSILSNPLFNVKPTRPRSKSSVLQNDGKPGNLAQIQCLIHQPLDYFKDQISSGTATLKSVNVFLRFQIQKARASSESEPFNFLKSSDTCSVVLDWFWSSGIKEATFLQDADFCALIMPFLVLEGREDVVWGWVRSLQESIRESSLYEERVKQRRIQATIILERLKFETLHGNGLDSAIQIFVKKSVELSRSKSILQKSARFLINYLLERHQDSTLENHQITPLISTVKFWSFWPEFHRAWLGLYTTGNLNVTYAVRFLQNADEARISALKGRTRLDVVSLSLRTAELLLSENLDSHALWVMNFLRIYFAEELDISTKVTKPPEAYEESTLQSLDALTVH